MSRLSRSWRDWEAFWDEREHPVSLALVRLLLGACFLYDFLHILRLGLVIPLFGVAEVGGFSDALLREHTPTFYQFVPATVAGAYLLHGTMTLSAFTLTIGLFSRTSAVVLLLSWAAFADVMPYADRGIDTLSRLALCILAVSGSGRFLSVDAWLSSRSVFGDGGEISAAPRRLLVLQLVFMYFAAGVSKVGITWWPWGHWAALYFALQDPAVAAYDFSYLSKQPFFFLTQFGTATTIVYQTTYPVVLLMMYWNRNPTVGGRVADFCRRWRLEWVWIGIGGIFHLCLALSMNLGIFPWAMLAAYPAWFAPTELLAISRRIRQRFAGGLASPQS